MTNLSDLRKTQDAAIGADGLDSAQVTTIATDAGIAVYTALDSLPSTGLTSGDQAWVESSGRLYISNGSGWYNIALVNASPTLSLDQSGTIQLNADTLSVVVTATATDTDDNQDIISFSVESDGNMFGTGTTVSQDSSVFTITALSQDSGAVSGNFTLTFKATDQIAVDNEALSFNLTFSNIVDSSAETILLLKGEGNSASNLAITYQNSSDASTGFTETNQPYAGTFSPYRRGGYSMGWQGAQPDHTAQSYLAIANDATMRFGTGNLTWEAWVYTFDHGENEMAIISQSVEDEGVGNNTGIIWQIGPGTTVTLQRANGQDLITGTPTAGTPRSRWMHYAVVRNGSTITLYADGQSVGTTTTSVNFDDAFTSRSETRTLIGQHETGTYPNLHFGGLINNLRMVKGTAVYTSNFDPPTDTLTAISGTSLLLFNDVGYVKDASSNSHSITIEDNGNYLAMIPAGPHDVTPWNDSDDCGSVYFDGADELNSGSIAGPGTGNFTMEAWAYFDNDASANETVIERSGSGSTRLIFGRKSTGVPRLYLWGSDKTISSPTLEKQIWYHMAVVRNSSTTKVYINGEEVYTQADTQNVTGSVVTSIGRNSDNAEPMTGYVADVRHSHTAEYTAEFTPPTAPHSTASTDRVRMNNKSDINIYDMSGSVNLGPSGGVVTSNTTRKFNTSSSIYFDGSDDHLVISAQNKGPWHWGEPFQYGDWTVEAWINQTSGSQSGYRTFFGSSNSGGILCSINNGTNIVLNLYGSSAPSGLDQSHTFTAGTWYHVAFTRLAGKAYIHVDGVLKNSGGTTFTSTITDRHYNIGAAGSSSISNNPIQEFAGYIQNLRVSRIARYGNSNFTAPTAEFKL